MFLKLKAKIIERFGTQADFAQVIKIDETVISRVIRGRRNLDPEAQEKWARALEDSRERLFSEKT